MNDNINTHTNYPDSNIKLEIPALNVTPLKKICMTIGELPASYLETMTYYEMLLWFIQFLQNTIIPTVNNNSDALQEVQTVVLELQEYINNYKDTIDSDVEDLENYINNYFDNLDVQDEINNKLDEMVEAGTLQEIITNYLNSKAIFSFDTVADLKDATNLIDGSYAKTLGYYQINDDGGSLYKIVNDDTLIDDGGSIIELENGLFAKLIANSTILVNQFGAYGDGLHDDTLSIQRAILYAKENNLTCINGLNKLYLVSDVVVLPQNISDASEKGLYIDFGVTFENFKLKLKNGVSNLTSVLNIANPSLSKCIINNVEIDGNSANQSASTSVQNGGLHGIRVGFPLTESFGGIIIKNSYIHDCYTDGITIRAIDFDSCIIDNCIVEKAGRNGITDNAINSLVENCKLIDNGTRQNPKSGYHIEPDLGHDFKVKTLRNCNISGTVENGICIYLNSNEHTFEKFNIINCVADNFYFTGIANNTNPSIIKNINIENSKFTSKGSYTRKTAHPSNFEFGNVFINNCEFLYSPQFAGSSSSNVANLNISNLTIKNSTFPEGHINLQYAFNKVIIEECDFKRADPPTENNPAANVFNIAYSDGGTVYPINSLIISKCNFYNYGRVIDNANYGTNVRPGKNIKNFTMKDNFYYTSGDNGIFIKNSKTITNGIVKDNILDVENGLNYRYQLGTCDNFIGSNNINNFTSVQGFDLTNVTTSIIEDNIFETSST